ncbi:MAG: peptidylprolyl isomerase, partial [Cycloclasticus sp.]|nr:peptidylprolyl isomerase [Cycloclasticus sp.]
MINNTLVLIKALLLGALLTLASTSLYATDTKKMSNPSVKLSTNQGDIIIELNAEAAPKTVANFIAYVEDGFYSGLIFHRVIPGFMVQGGGYMADYKQKDTKDQIENEADNG